jgi:hypothetical protein
MSGKLWPLHHNFYSSSEDVDKQRNQRLQQEPNQDQHHSPKYIGSSLIHTSKGWCKGISYLPNERVVLAITW